MELQQLPPGFRFHPTDEELVSYYLCRKCAGLPLAAPVVAEVDLYRFDPWQLPEKAATATGGAGGGENKEKEWYFFSPRDRKYPNGSRPNRSAGTGYWKATGADKPVGSPRTLAIKKALVFYAGKPAGPRAAVKTNWIMHEYRLADVDRSAAARKRTNHNNNNNALRLDDWVLCRIYNKKGVIERYDTVDDDDDGDGDGVKPRAAAAAVPGRTTVRGNTASAAAGGGGAAAGMMKVEVQDEYGSYCYDNYDDLVGTPAAEMLCFDRPFLPPVPADHDDRHRRRSGGSGDSARHATTPAAAADNSSCGSEHVLSPSPELPDSNHAESQPGGGAAGWFDGCGGGGWGGGCAEYDGFVVVDDGGALFGSPPSPSPALFTSRDAATLAEMLAYLQRPL